MQKGSVQTIGSLARITPGEIPEKIVSFDLFDTLIKRRYLAVNEVHDTVSAYLLARLGKARDISPGHITLARYNTGNFLKTSPHVNMEEPSLPLVWQHIVSSLSDHRDASADAIIDDVIDFEFDLDLKNLGLVQNAAETLQKLKSAGKRLIAVSDMYFTHSQIETILSKLGIARFFEKIFVSVDVGLTKQTGRLFQHVSAELGVSPREIHHIGDNPHSDIKMAGKIGLSATQIDQPDHLRLERPSYGRRPDIHVEIADLSKAFLSQILMRGVNNRTNHIYFMSRDGLLLRQVLEQWNSPLVKRYLDVSQKSDLFISRATSCWLALNFRGEWLTQAVGFAFWLCHGTATLRQISDLFGISDVPPGHEDIQYSASRDTTLVVNAYQTADLADEIYDSLLAKRQIAQEYLVEAGIFAGRHVTLCDIGYSGTVARDLNSFFLQESFRPETPPPPKVQLELLSTNGNFKSNAALSRPYVHFADSCVLPHERLPETLTDSFAWLEVFFKHPNYGPLRGYALEKGRVVPDYDTDSLTTEVYPYDRIVKASQFKDEDIIFIWMASISFWDQFTDPLIARFAAPDLNTIGQMQVAIYEDDAVSDRKRSIVLSRPDLSADEVYALAKRNDYWIPGSLLASSNLDDASQTSVDDGGQDSNPELSAGEFRRNPMRRKLGALLPARKIQRTIHNQLQIARLKIGGVHFDPNFYRTYYPDLAGLDERAARRHFIEHGRREGRFAAPEALLSHLEAEHEDLPADFDAAVYRSLHGDLPFEMDWQLKAHYLIFGRRERRLYHSAVEVNDDEFEDLIRSGTVELTARERAAWLKGTPARKLIFDRSGVEPGAWLNLLHFGEFQALNYGWAGSLRSRAHAVQVFLDRGLAKLAPLSLGGRFDVEYYTRKHPHLAASAPEDAYRFWLRHGAGVGEAACEDDRLFQLLGERAFPDAFKHHVFAKRYPLQSEAGEPLDRTELLAVFLGGGYTADTDLVDGPGASRLWEIVARQARDRGHLDEAQQAYENALACGGAPGRILHHIGDLLTRQRRLHDALDAYERCVAAPNADRWSFINGARLAADLGYFEKAFRFIEEGSTLWAVKEPWRRARDHALSAWFHHSLEQKRDSSAGSSLSTITDKIAQLLDKELASSIPAMQRDARVLILDRSRHQELSEKVKRRIATSIEHEFGLRAEIFSMDQIDLLHASLPRASGIVFHEIRSEPATIRIALLAKRMSVPTLYSAGSLDGSDSPAFRDASVSTELAALLRDDRALHFMSLCDRGLATLPVAAEVLERTTGDRKAALIGRVSRLMQHRTLALSGATFVVRFGFADSERHLRSQAWAAVGHLLSQRSDILIVYDQSLIPPRQLRPYGGRLIASDVRATDATVPIFLATVRGCILFAPKTQSAEIEFGLGRREADLAGIPVCVIGEGQLLSGSKGQSSSEISSDLLRFVDEVARTREVEPQKLMAPGELLPAPVGTDEPTGDDPKGRRTRILYANVFFAPQTVGGATRVLKDNVDYMIDNHQKEFELAVFASDDENDAVGATRIDAYRGVPVFRIATPQEMDMDWRPYNAEVYRHFVTVLRAFKPDIVHIHCLQRLSVAIAEACQSEGIPYLVTLHDAWWLSDYSFLTNEDGELVMPSKNVAEQRYARRIGFTESLARAAQLRSALAKAEARLAVSQSFGDLYASCGFEIETVANGVSRLSASPRVAGERHVRLAHLGGTQHHKGLYLIEAILRRHSFKNISFTYIDLFRDRGDISHSVWGTTPVTTLGKIPSGEIEKVYARTDVLVAPSTWPESFGLVSREALNAGCWVVASTLGAMGDEVVSGVNGFLVDVAKPDDLLQVLRTIDDNPGIYKTSPDQAGPMRTADEQSEDLVGRYRRMMSRC